MMGSWAPSTVTTVRELRPSRHFHFWRRVLYSCNQYQQRSFPSPSLCTLQQHSSSRNGSTSDKHLVSPFFLLLEFSLVISTNRVDSAAPHCFFPATLAAPGRWAGLQLKLQPSGHLSSKMITRRNLAEQLRDYQLRSQRDWSSLSFWASVNRDDATTPSRWGVFLVVILLFSAATFLYFKDITFTLSLLVIGSALLLCCQAIGNRISRRRQKRILP